MHNKDEYKTMKQKYLKEYIVKIVEPGAKYGRDDVLVNDSGKRIVEFYGKEKENFIASYYDTAILNVEDGRSLCIKLISPVESINAEEVKEIKEWLK